MGRQRASLRDAMSEEDELKHRAKQRDMNEKAAKDMAHQLWRRVHHVHPRIIDDSKNELLYVRYDETGENVTDMAHFMLGIVRSMIDVQLFQKLDQRKKRR